MLSKRKRKRAAAGFGRRRLVFLLGEAVERVLRLQRILERQRIYTAAEHRQLEYSGALGTLSRVINDYKKLLVSNSARIVSLLANKPLSNRDLKTLSKVVKQVLREIHGIHELFVLLPREAAESQAFFVLRDCFRWQEPHIEIAVMLTNLIGAYEFRIEDVLRGMEMSQNELLDLRQIQKDFSPEGSVLGLAFIDRDNPLAWSVLAHEYGHALDDAQHVASQIIHGDQAPSSENEVSEKWKVRWTAELFCDFVAAYVLGPVSLIQILLVEMMRPHLITADDELNGHPPTPVRIKLVRDYLTTLGVSMNDFNEIFEVYDFDYTEKLSEMPKEQQIMKAKMRELANELLSNLAAIISAKVELQGLRRFTSERAGVAKKLEKKFRSGLPISSCRALSDKEALKRIEALTKGRRSPEDVYAALQSLDETPTNSAEILTAGWLYKLTTFDKRLLDSFRDAITEEQLNGYDEYLSQTDALLLKSLELAALQIEMRESAVMA